MELEKALKKAPCRENRVERVAEINPQEGNAPKEEAWGGSETKVGVKRHDVSYRSAITDE